MAVFQRLFLSTVLLSTLLYLTLCTSSVSGVNLNGNLQQQPHYKFVAVIPVSLESTKYFTLRDTWLRESKKDSSTWTYRFFFGSSHNQSLMAEARKQQQKYGDIVILDIIDSYWNLTLKVTEATKWAVENLSFDYLLKSDDDTYVQPQNLEKIFDSAPKTGFYGGQIEGPYVPDRRKDTFWYVSEEEFPPKQGHKWALGLGYVMSHDAAQIIANAKNDPFFYPIRIEDVAVGWLLGNHSYVPTLLPNFNDHCKCMNNAVLSHRCDPPMQQALYRNFTEIGSICGAQ